MVIMLCYQKVSEFEQLLDKDSLASRQRKLRSLFLKTQACGKSTLREILRD
jgi:hypothetical protein